MKGYKNLKELNKEWSKFGFRINEKRELSVIGEQDGKEYKIGKVRLVVNLIRTRDRY